MQGTRDILSEAIRARSVELLNRHLAAAIDLRVQAKQARWNLHGPGCLAIADLLDKVVAEIENHSDLIARRTGALGGTAEGTIQVAVQRSFLDPYPLGIADVTCHVFVVSRVLAAFSQSVRNAVRQATNFGDVMTAEVLKVVLCGIDRQLWLVESHVAPTSAEVARDAMGQLRSVHSLVAPQ